MASDGLGRWPRFTLADGDYARAFMAQHGWVIFRDVFSSEEIEALRESAMQPEQIDHQGDILSNPSVPPEAFLLDARVLQIVSVLVESRPCYFGDSSVSINGKILGFHKDNANRHDPTARDWNSDYNLIRLGLYLQDHARHSGGLSVRDGSHTSADHAFGEPVSIPTLAGDVVAWRLTTTHSGEALRLRQFHSLFVPIPVARVMGLRLFRSIRNAIFRPRQYKDRIALFATFGAAGDHLSHYLDYLKTRSYAVTCWRHSNYSKAQRELARKAGLELIEMGAEAAALDVATLNDEYVAPTG